MAKKETVDTHHGKHSKYEVRKKSSVFGTSYHVNKDGETETGRFDSREAANEWVDENKKK
jgi:hypothetical protein